MNAPHALAGTPVAVQRLHHYAYKCRDAEETRHFYEDVLGLPLVHIIRADYVPSTQEHYPYVHLFFQLQDGSCIAFFDLGDDQAAMPSLNTPKWVNHIAFTVNTMDELHRAKARLEAAGVSVLGPTDHHFVHSIYFFDPNGVRLELTCEVGDADYVATKRASARDELDAWTREKTQLRAARQSV